MTLNDTPRESIWYQNQRAESTISRVRSLLENTTKPFTEDLKHDSLLKSYVNVWTQFLLKDILFKHCNERSVSKRIVLVSGFFVDVMR